MKRKSRGDRVYQVVINVIAVLIGGQEYRDFDVVRDPYLSEAVYRAEREFWTFVETDTPPPPQTALEVIQLFPRDSGRAIPATPELIELHEELVCARAECKSWEETVERLTGCLKLELKDADQIVDERGNTLVSWRAAKDSTATAWKDVVSELGKHVAPEIFDAAVAKYTTVKPGSRRFLVKEPQ